VARPSPEGRPEVAVRCSGPLAALPESTASDTAFRVLVSPLSPCPLPESLLHNFGTRPAPWRRSGRPSLPARYLTLSGVRFQPRTGWAGYQRPDPGREDGPRHRRGFPGGLLRGPASWCVAAGLRSRWWGRHGRGPVRGESEYARGPPVIGEQQPFPHVIQTRWPTGDTLSWIPFKNCMTVGRPYSS
jgi:hypothetical protein